MADETIPFNRPHATGRELGYVAQAHIARQLSGDGAFTKKCHAWLEQETGCDRALLTHSCTSALDLAAMLLDLQPGDEVIMPSYTFVSTANAFVLRGAVPVFVDIRPDTLNIDETLIEAAITPRTRAIAPVHYAGVGCEMDAILDIARRHSLKVVEDAAQGICATYRGKPLGAIGDLGCFSFHETKNVSCGEGGALLVNDPSLSQRAEIMREKGTDRGRFFRGEVDKYTWQDMGSSLLPSEITAAYLFAQLEDSKSITADRVEAWRRYHALLEPLEADGLLGRPVVPAHCEANGHIYYILVNEASQRDPVISALRSHHINTVFHYVPLHSAPAGRRFGRTHAELRHTDDLSARLIRLPMFFGLTSAHQERVRDALASILPSLQASVAPRRSASQG